MAVKAEVKTDAKTVAKVDEKSAEKKAPRLTPNKLLQADYTRTVWSVESTAEVTKDELLDTEYWTNVAHMFKAGDRIEVVPANKMFFAEFFVLACAKNWAKVALLRYHELIAQMPESVGQKYTISWGGADKWRVLRGVDVLSKDHDSDGLAKAWLKEYKEKMGENGSRQTLII